ncbi:GGDEF domain-containing protein [Kamptonema cortianum]|nr:GGDEF domain-containing protein [Geitlerinema splendidum]MDK3160928.1 GGDEF domain-containing protein [Kamptonema cortianum]
MKQIRSNQSRSQPNNFDILLEAAESLTFEPTSYEVQDFLETLNKATRELGNESALEICAEFGESQRRKVRSIIFSLDGSLRRLAHELESVLSSSDLAMAETEGVHHRLTQVQSAGSLDEIKALVEREISDLAKLVATHRRNAKRLRKEYFEELSKMRNRLEEAQEAASTDPLTKLPNRRIHNLTLIRSIQNANPAAPESLALIDLDGFKWINDRYGHAAGDRALIKFAHALYGVFGDESFVARLGGDEFTIIAPYKVSRLARELENFRETMLKIRVDVGKARVRTLPSYGCSGIEPGSRPEQLMAEVDAKMYEFKRAHRPKQAS